MGNPQHLEWLLEGVEAWNARRKRKDFQPDFLGFDIFEAFEETGNLTAHGSIPLMGANFSGANLAGTNLKDAYLEGADLMMADLAAANLGGAHLGAADLRLAQLEGAYLGDAHLGEANLGGASLGGVYFGRADLGGANLIGADLGRADFGRAYLKGSIVRTGYPGSATENRAKPQYTDLSKAFYLTQDQINSMNGDTGTILPPGLTHPPHWPDPEPPNNTPVPEANPPHEVTATQIQKKLVENREATVLTSAALLDQIAEYRFKVYSDNQLACDHPEFRDELLAFLDQLSGDIETLLQAIPAQGAKATEQQAEQAATWFDRFAGAAIPEWKKYLAPEALGKASVPSGIILTCGALGSLVSGMNPLGFGAGAVVGKLIVGEVKSGQAADKLKDMFDDPEDEE